MFLTTGEVDLVKSIKAHNNLILAVPRCSFDASFGIAFG